MAVTEPVTFVTDAVNDTGDGGSIRKSIGAFTYNQPNSRSIDGHDTAGADRRSSNRCDNAATTIAGVTNGTQAPREPAGAGSFVIGSTHAAIHHSCVGVVTGRFHCCHMPAAGGSNAKTSSDGIPGVTGA